MRALHNEFAFDFDPCPYPRPAAFDGLACEWGRSNYVNPPFKGPTAWVRKALREHAKGKRVVFVFPVDKWVLLLLEAGATVRNLRDVKWCATEDGLPGAGTGRHIAAFVLEPRVEIAADAALPDPFEVYRPNATADLFAGAV
jgi:hypothetical protein